MLIIAGHLVVDPTEREAPMAVDTQVVALARAAPGCVDLAITADTLDPARILDADVERYTISAVGEP